MHLIFDRVMGWKISVHVQPRSFAWVKIACLDVPNGDDDECQKREHMDLELRLVAYWGKSPVHRFLAKYHARSRHEQRRIY